jgi:hypothetical protein
MEILIIFIALLLISLLTLINAFHILSLSQKNIKNARQKLDTSILYYFDLVPRQLLEVDKLESETAKQYFNRKKNLNSSNLVEQFKQQRTDFQSQSLTTQAHLVSENIHSFNYFVIKLEHKLNGNVYQFLAKFLNLKVPTHISE